MKPAIGTAYSLTAAASIGLTSCGEVFRVATTLHSDVAMKVPLKVGDQNQVTYLKREGLALSMIGDHQNIVRLYGQLNANGSPWLLLELLQRRPPIARFPTATIISQLADICLAFDAIHQRGIVHRDFDLANIMVDAAGRWKIIDFRAAYIPRTAEPNAAPAAIGTASVMPPEAWNGTVDDPRSDLYSIGCCLFRFMSNAYPFGEAPRNTVRLAHLNNAAPALVRQNPPPQELVDLIADLLKKDPNNRIQTALDVRARIQALPPIP